MYNLLFYVYYVFFSYPRNHSLKSHTVTVRLYKPLKSTKYIYESWSNSNQNNKELEASGEVTLKEI